MLPEPNLWSDLRDRDRELHTEEVEQAQQVHLAQQQHLLSSSTVSSSDSTTVDPCRTLIR